MANTEIGDHMVNSVGTKCNACMLKEKCRYLESVISGWRSRTSTAIWKN